MCGSVRYRMFGELLEMVVAHGLKIQAPIPAYAVPNTLESGGTTEEVLVSAVKPLLVLQNPGYYYYTAGNCAVQRKIMFERAMASEVSPARGHMKPLWAHKYRPTGKTFAGVCDSLEQ